MLLCLMVVSWCVRVFGIIGNVIVLLWLVMMVGRFGDVDVMFVVWLLVWYLVMFSMVIVGSMSNQVFRVGVKVIGGGECLWCIGKF